MSGVHYCSADYCLGWDHPAPHTAGCRNPPTPAVWRALLNDRDALRARVAELERQLASMIEDDEKVCENNRDRDPCGRCHGCAMAGLDPADTE